MISRIVRLALRWSVVTIVFATTLGVAGLYAYSQLDIEAYPNPIPPMVELITQPNGWSAEEVERYVTIPLEIGLAGMPGLDQIRSQSLFGLSDIKCYFKWGVEYKDARQEVINRLSFIDLPNNIKPQISPWNAIGEVFRYRVYGTGYTLADLKTAQDWILEKEFRQVDGVIDVVGFGGHTKEYHVEVDPYRLKSHNLTLGQLIAAVSNANLNVGGQRITLGEQSFNIRGIGVIRSLRDIENIVIANVAGVPVRVRDVAGVSIGAAPRLGIVGKDADPDVVQGTVLMRYGSSTEKTLRGIHERLEYIRKYHLLPPGMEIAPYYDRSRLVRLTTHTVLENLLVGMLLVTGVLWLFLGHTRAALITAINIPLALLAAFIGMVSTHTAANLISLGAVDFGIVVDSTVIMMENIFRHLGRIGQGDIRERIARAATEVGPPMFFSTLVIAVAFVPLFTLTGVAGVIFSPMAKTYAFAIGGAILLALTLTPVISGLLLSIEPVETNHAATAAAADADEHDSNWLMRAFDRCYRPIFRFALRYNMLAIGLVTVPVMITLLLAGALGREFMPKLEEGNFWIRATLPTSIALDQSGKYVGRMRAIVLGCPEHGHSCDFDHRSIPEIETVVSQLGRPDDGTDVSGFNNIELFAPLKPTAEWRPGITKAKLTEELAHHLRDAFPGVIFNFSQAISDNVEEAISGVKGENTVKVIGPDIRVNETKASEIVGVMATVPGVADLGRFPSLGQPDIRITPDRLQCGRYGLNVGDIEAVVQAAIGGQAVTQVYEGEKRFDLTVRFAADYRKDLRTIRSILVAAPDGTQIPLGQLAEVVEEEGPAVIYRENNRRYSPVKFSVRGRDLASTIAQAQARIRSKVKLPYDTHLEWAGEINQLNETTSRLTLIVPLTLLVIAFLVYSSVKNWKDLLIVLGGIPVACSGGVLALFLTRTTFSISAAMGFISIFGIAIQDSLIVVTYAQRLWDGGYNLMDGARLAAERRLRPVLMTTFVAMLGLLPAALSHGIGSETQKPLAIVVIGGALVMAILPRLLQAPLLLVAHRGERRWKVQARAQGQGDEQA